MITIVVTTTMRDLERGIVAYSVVSCVFSLWVVVTVLFFPSMRKGTFMKIILFMSVSDFCMNLASALGFPHDGTYRCWIQGVMVNYFVLCSWFWTTLLAYRVYCTVRYRKARLNMMQMTCIGWFMPALITLLPLATTTVKYGASEPRSQWCLMQATDHAPPWLINFWNYIAIFAWLFICIICMLVWQTIISIHFRKSPVREIVSRTYDKVCLYPVAMIVCWMLNFWCDAVSTHSGGALDAVSMIFGITNGLLAAVIFMWKSEEAQRRWWLYFFPPAMSRLEQLTEPTVRLDFEEDDADDDPAADEGMHGQGGLGYRSSGGISRPHGSIGMSFTASSSRGTGGAAGSVVGSVSDIIMSDLTVTTMGSSPLQSVA